MRLHLIGTADQFGIFLINILQANKIAVTKSKPRPFAPLCRVVITR